MTTPPEVSEVGYRVLRELRGLGPVGVESNQRSYGTLLTVMEIALGINAVDLRPTIDLLAQNAYIQLDTRMGFQGGIYRATLTERGHTALFRFDKAAADAATVRAGGKPVIFISCGQHRENERRIGHALAQIVDAELPATGYYAQNQSSFEAVVTNVLGALNTCAGFVGVLHKRGSGTLGDADFDRASVWIEQEIAIATFISQILGRPIPVQLYVQNGIELIGIRSLIITNPIYFDTEDEIEAHFRGVVRRRFGTLVAPASPDGEAGPNLRSPLTPKPMAHVLPRVADANTPFYGLDIQPWSYATSERVLDSVDETDIKRAVGQSTARHLHGDLSAATLGPSVFFTARDEPPEDSSLNATGGKALSESIQVMSDGDIAMLIPAGNGQQHEFRVLALFGTAYILIKAIYPVLGLKCRARLLTTIRTVDKDGQVRGLSTHPFAVDLERDTFDVAFRDLLLMTLRDDGKEDTPSRDKAQLMLKTFYDSSLR